MILVTEWNEFKKMDLKKVKSLVKTPIFVDGRNVFDYDDMTNLGFKYYCIGKRDAGFEGNKIKEVIFNNQINI